jgi:hypothetical protein
MAERKWVALSYLVVTQYNTVYFKSWVLHLNKMIFDKIKAVVTFVWSYNNAKYCKDIIICETKFKIQ